MANKHTLIMIHQPSGVSVTMGTDEYHEKNHFGKRVMHYAVERVLEENKPNGEHVDLTYMYTGKRKINGLSIIGRHHADNTTADAMIQDVLETLPNVSWKNIEAYAYFNDDTAVDLVMRDPDDVSAPVMASFNEVVNSIREDEKLGMTKGKQGLKNKKTKKKKTKKKSQFQKASRSRGKKSNTKQKFIGR